MNAAGRETSPTYAWYVVVVLTLGYIVSFIDRQILSLLIDPIRRELGLGDFQMSLVSDLFARGIGQFIGPTSVAFLTEFVFRDPAALRYSMAIAVLTTSLRPYREARVLLERTLPPVAAGGTVRAA